MKIRLLKSVSVVLILAILGMLTVSFVHDTFTSKIPGANDFYPRWKGATLLLEEGINPYSTQATQHIQMDIYGRLAQPDEDQVAFAYPLYTVFLLAPLVLLDISYAMASAIWIVGLLAALYLGFVLSARLLLPRMPAWFTMIFFLWAILFYNSIRTLVLGQFAGLIFLLVVATLLALRRGHDVLAGFLLAVATVKPQMTLFLAVGLLLWSFRFSRFRFATGFLGTLAFLATMSFAILPSWLGDFLHQINNYMDYTATGPPVWVIAGYYFPQLGRSVEIGLTLLILIVLLLTWFRLSRRDHADDVLLPLAAATLLIGELIVPRTATTNQIVLFIPIMWIVGRAIAQDALSHGWLVCLMFGTLVTGWLMFLQTHVGIWESPIMFLLLPGMALSLIVWEFHRTSKPVSSQRTQTRSFKDRVNV